MSLSRDSSWKSRLKAGLKPVPGVAATYRWLRGFSAEWIFTDIFEANAWYGITTRSGRGSDPDQTRILIAELSALIGRRKISSLLDIPCGEFSWMRLVDLSGVHYIGQDIVKEVVDRNRAYESDHRTFSRANLLADKLPSADLVLCRDCFVHFCYSDIWRALRNICRSGSTYLLATTFPTRRNQDIRTGSWRFLNLQAEPFNLPQPLELITEGCNLPSAWPAVSAADKSLGLWRIGDIESRVELATRRAGLATRLFGGQIQGNRNFRVKPS